jgi:hypothetical protein
MIAADHDRFHRALAVDEKTDLTIQFKRELRQKMGQFVGDDLGG